MNFLRDLDGYGANAQVNFAKGDSMLCVVRNCLSQVAEESTCAEGGKRRWQKGTVPGLRPDCTVSESQHVACDVC